MGDIHDRPAPGAIPGDGTGVVGDGEQPAGDEHLHLRPEHRGQVGQGDPTAGNLAVSINDD